MLDVIPERRILGLQFFRGTALDAVQRALHGGLVAVPSAPVLVDLDRDPASREALQNADLVLTDSGLMVLTWRLLTGERLVRISGLEYLRLLLAEPAFRSAPPPFWVLPSEPSRDRTIEWLACQGILCSREDCYVAPVYPKGPLEDPQLLERLRARGARHVILAIGGGTQERLGLFLRKRLHDQLPGIHCIGAAIGFLTGEQVGIPMWADRLFVGWLFRCMSHPRRFIPRYWRAGRLVPLMWRFRDRLPT